MKRIWVLSAILLGLVAYIVVRPSDGGGDSKPKEPLDYSKPIFTTSLTIISPQSLLSDMRADHAPDRVVDMFYSVWYRSDKAKELGCEELQAGIPVSATSLEGGFATVRLPGDAGGNLFTVEGELTNEVPGQSDAKKVELATPQINKVPAGPIPLLDSASPSIGTMLVTIPSREPIPQGNVRAASDSEGFGAIICPDSTTLAAMLDASTATQSTKTEEANAKDLEALRLYGCSYLPPGTPMESKGANGVGSLAAVTLTLPDGTKMEGVTFPSMITQSQEQREEAQSQALLEQQTEQQAQQQRYEELMRPEEQRHAAAVKQEGERHQSVLDSLNLEVSQLDVTRMSGREVQEFATRHLACGQGS